CEGVTELARSEEIATLPAATLHLLGRSFYGTVAVDHALTVMRLAQKRYPGDFWINFYLGAFLAESHPPPMGRSQPLLHGRRGFAQPERPTLAQPRLCPVGEGEPGRGHSRHP